MMKYTADCELYGTKIMSSGCSFLVS